MKVGDFIIVALALGLCGGLAWVVYADTGASPILHVSAAGGEWYYPLDRNREIDVSGPLGVTRVVIENGAARIVDSPCPNKICIHSGAVSRTGGWIACLPNRVLLTVEGAREASYDAESY